MKIHSSVEALYALIFAICVLLALFLLTSCGAKEAAVAQARPTLAEMMSPDLTCSTPPPTPRTWG